MNTYKVSSEYRNILIPIGIIIFASGIYTFGDIYGSITRIIFIVGTIFLIYKYLTMFHTVIINTNNMVTLKSFIRKREINTNDIIKVEDYDFFIRVVNDKRSVILICLFDQFTSMKNVLLKLHPKIEFIDYEQAGENLDRKFWKYVKLLFNFFV